MSVTSYQQVIKNLEYLGLKQMVTHLSNVIDFSVHNQLSFMDTLIKCHDLIQKLKRARLENRLESRLKHYTKYKLLIIDEISYLPFS